MANPFDDLIPDSNVAVESNPFDDIIPPKSSEEIDLNRPLFKIKMVHFHPVSHSPTGPHLPTTPTQAPQQAKTSLKHIF